MLRETPADAKQNSFLSELARGAKEAFKNAEQLFQEASLLLQHGAVTRALFLHQISMEECAKVEILGGYATGLLMGLEIDAKKLVAALASHKAKNRANAYMLELNEEEIAALKRRNWKGKNEAFSRYQTEFHLKSNTAKNASLYVDFVDGKFVTPSERISRDMVISMAAMNERYLGLMYPWMNMLLKWEDNPNSISNTLKQFKQRTEQLALEFPDDPLKVMEILLQEMLEDALAERRQT